MNNPTDNEIRKLIAKILDWEFFQEEEYCLWYDDENIGNETDPLVDLNAMHEAKKCLKSQEKRDTYAAFLIQVITGNQANASGIVDTDTKVLFATARQQALALYKTIVSFRDINSVN